MYVTGCQIRNPGIGPRGTSPKCRLIQTVAECVTGDSNSHASVCSRNTPVQIKTSSFTAGVINPRQSNPTRGAKVELIFAVYGEPSFSVKREEGACVLAETSLIAVRVNQYEPASSFETTTFSTRTTGKLGPGSHHRPDATPAPPISFTQLQSVSKSR